MSRVHEYYFNKASLGILPKMVVYHNRDNQLNELEVLGRLSISDHVGNMVGLVYPERQTISFNSYSEISLGDRVTVYIYYDGYSYRGVVPFGLTNPHPGCTYTGKVVEKSTKLADGRDDKIYSYKVDKDFRELDDMVRIGVGDTIGTIINRVPHIVSFESELAGAESYQVHTAPDESEMRLDHLLSQFSQYASYRSQVIGNTGGLPPSYCYCSIDDGVLKLHRVDEEGTFDVITRQNTTTPITETVSANKQIKSVYWGELVDEQFDKQDVSDTSVWEYLPGDYEGIYWKNGQRYPSDSPSWPISKSGDIVTFVPYSHFGKRKWEVRDDEGYRYYEYYEKDIGEIKSVMNVWVNTIHEREGFLDLTLKNTEQSGKYDMLTNLFFIPLGSVVTVETSKAGKGWKGVMIGKDINVSIGKNNYNFTYSLKVQKVIGEVDYCFDWGDAWDNGKEFC